MEERWGGRWGGPMLAAVLFAAAGPASTWAAHAPEGPSFALTRLELLFQNGRPDITVPKNFPGLRVYARASFEGTGLFDALWVVDGRILAQVTEPVLFGDVLLFATPRQPTLPTFEPGIHRVTLQVRTPMTAGRIPSITYFVTADEFVPPPREGQP